MPGRSANETIDRIDNYVLSFYNSAGCHFLAPLQCRRLYPLRKQPYAKNGVWLGPGKLLAHNSAPLQLYADLCTNLTYSASARTCGTVRIDVSKEFATKLCIVLLLRSATMQCLGRPSDPLMAISRQQDIATVPVSPTLANAPPVTAFACRAEEAAEVDSGLTGCISQSVSGEWKQLELHSTLDHTG